MSRVFFIRDDNGEKRLDEADFPLTVGGADTDVVLPGQSADMVLAYIAMEKGHAYIQPIDEEVELFHNHERTLVSNWLKSGDVVQLGDQFLHWTVKGDQVFITLQAHAEEPELTPPAESPPVVEEPSESVPVAPLPAAAAAEVKKSHKWRNPMIAAFVLLLVIALFILFASPLAITVKPQPESLSVSGFPPPVTLGQRRLVIPGSYTLRAELEGYYPLEEDIQVASGGLQAFEYQMQELPGKLELTITPTVPFRLLVDAEEVKVDAANTALVKRGMRSMLIKTERYLPYETELDVAGFGALQKLDAVLQPAWADVFLDSLPQGAQVQVDGQVVGMTPLSAELVQGERSIELSLAGYKLRQLSFVITAGVALTPEVIALEPNDGRLLLSSQPAGATVSVDGTFFGSTPVDIVLTSGQDHKIHLNKPGFKKVKRTIRLDADEERQLSLKLVAEYGTVFVNSQPADASLMVDGKPVGAATQRLRLSAQRHVLTFSKSGYVTQNLTLTPLAGTSQRVEISLKTEQQAKDEATPPMYKNVMGQEMRLLKPTGSFQMGASRREAGRRANESQRLVALSRPFYLSVFEVTNAEFRRFQRQHDSGSAEGVSLNGENYPVVNVSWDDAARYCNWLSQQEKLPLAYREEGGRMVPEAKANGGYRLPSEAEWAFAARLAGRDSAASYPWKGSYPPVLAVGNFADSGIADTLADVVPGYTDGYRGPAPVGSFPILPSGFRDLGGNVAEWVNDFYAVYPGDANRLVKDPVGPANGEHHVVRDSSWRDGSITELRLSYRDYSRTGRDNLGFRIARYAYE